MRRSPANRPHPLLRSIEHSLSPGTFIGWRDGSEFVQGLDEVRRKIAALGRRGEAGRAVSLFEAFIAGCYEKADEIDDSGGNLGMFVEELFCEWIRARQRAKADPDETAGMLVSWMENDNYGFCHRLEKDAVKVLDRAGLSAFERAVGGREATGEHAEYRRRRKLDALKAIHQRRDDVPAYAALCEREKDLGPDDCEALAKMCMKRRRPEDALGWAERGLRLEKEDRWPNRSATGLADLRREILKKAGRGKDALASAWEEYDERPSVCRYEEVMKFVPKGARVEWHAKALSVLEGTDLDSRISVLVKTKEVERLAEVVGEASRENLAGLSHYTTEPAAKVLAKSHSILAAKLCVAMALRILGEGKSKYYDAAFGHLEEARAIFLKEGKGAEWEELAAEIRERHGRRSSFMPGFERLVAEGSARGPSFLDRVRARWEQGAGCRREGS